LPWFKAAALGFRGPPTELVDAEGGQSGGTREDDRTEEERHDDGASRPHCGSSGSARVSKTPAKLQGMEDEE
jgi:hypothetical protein